MLRLVEAAIHVLDECGDDPSLARYFDLRTVGVRETITKILKALRGPTKLGAEEMLTPGFELEVWYRYGSLAKQRAEQSRCSRPGLLGFLTQYVRDPRFAWIVLCPDTFVRYPPTLDSIRCDQLDSVASRK